MPYDRLERWLATYRPHILENLRPPANDLELADLQAAFDVPLPPSLLRLYRWRNGQYADRAGPFYGLAFLGIDEVLRTLEDWKEVIAQHPDLNVSGFNSSVVPGVVKEMYANPLWIPFTHDWSGNHIGVDLDPGPNGRVGQVINFGPDEDSKFVLGQTVDDLVERIVVELEAGNFVLGEPPDDGFDTREPPSGHFTDSARVWFAAP